ncbi:acyl-CoA dehydrogenase family protein [Actinospongicola halichondriae]|uniref:acyl-CoA dehydrogenase family protein n=1 Tax=Actinospongicola halichondriae TaxID=3236844 RepID=UPI003D4BDC63
MRFTLGEDRVDFAAAVRKALADGCPPAVVRAAWDGELNPAIWSTLVEMGTTDPDLDWVTRVAVAEEVGRAALPHPWVESAFVCGPAAGAACFGSTDAGTAPYVPAGADVDVVLLVTDDGCALHEQSGIETSPVATVDGSRRLVEVTSRTSGTTVDPGVDPFLAGALGTAGVLVGLGQHLVDATVAYVSERHQFGQPVGGFQAVKHHLANAAKDVAFARPMVHRAAHGLDTDDPGAARDVSTAKALASDAATLAAEVALQCHGAIGYTVEYDLHLWLKRVWALSRAWGDASHHRALVAESLGLTAR